MKYTIILFSWMWWILFHCELWTIGYPDDIWPSRTEYSPLETMVLHTAIPSTNGRGSAPFLFFSRFCIRWRIPRASFSRDVIAASSLFPRSIWLLYAGYSLAHPVHCRGTNPSRHTRNNSRSIRSGSDSPRSTKKADVYFLSALFTRVTATI